MLSARYPALNKTIYICPNCKLGLRQVPFPQAYNLLSFWLMLPGAPAIELLLSEQEFSGIWWALPVALAFPGLLGLRWSIRSMPENFRRYEKT